MVDRDVTVNLRAEGIRYDRDNAVLYFEKDGLSSGDMEAFSTLVNQGIKDIENLLKIPDDKRREKTNPIFYFISSKIDISRSRMRTVYLPLWRVQRHEAPYLHETSHILARCDGCPMWFSEGFASWIQSYISENVGGYDAKVFARRGNQGVDAEAARWLGTSNGQAVLPFVTGAGVPPDIGTERRAVGTPFYVMSQSLVKHLVQKAGIEKVYALSESKSFEQDIEQAAGEPLQLLTSGWLASLPTGFAPGAERNSRQ